VVALILALSHSMAAGAAAPVAYQANCIPINYTTCVTNGTTLVNGNVGATYAVPTSGIAPNSVVSSYFDPRYGFVSVVTDSSGNLIDVNSATGQRIFPVFPDYGFGGVLGNAFIGANFNNGVIGNGVIGNGVICNGVFGCPGVFNNFAGCNVNINCGAFPAGATYVGGGVYAYRDGRFCGDGNLGFVAGRGSFCQNGQPLFANGNGFFGNGVFGNGFVYPNYRPFEVTQPATAPAAAPVAAAPVAAPVAPVAAPAVVQQAPAAPAAMPTALTAPQVQTPDAAPAGGSNVHVLSAPATTAPAVTRDLDDHR
jgi:hypothetical protein